jgi:hypothetical protein
MAAAAAEALPSSRRGLRGAAAAAATEVHSLSSWQKHAAPTQAAGAGRQGASRLAVAGTAAAADLGGGGEGRWHALDAGAAQATAGDSDDTGGSLSPASHHSVLAAIQEARAQQPARQHANYALQRAG